MRTLKIAATAVALASLLAAAGIVASPAAHADAVPAIATTSESAPMPVSDISDQQLAEAVQEARALGYVRSEILDRDGSLRTTIDLSDGFTFEVIRKTEPTPRLGAGKDSIGSYVSFNATDQNAIISGAAFGLGAALCVISAGTFCLVAGVIITAATVAMQGQRRDPVRD
jgi:hypothetical protein